MKKTVLLAFAFFGIFLQIESQNTNNITGSIYDETSRDAIEFASVRILNASDSSYVTGTTSDKNGKFRITLQAKSYIVHISYLGYTDYYSKFNPSQKTQLGDIFLREDGIALSEAVVTAKAIEIQISGDTIEFNADSYKVQESAVLEDLLKKMPGVEIDENGKITVNGKEITKILVDGKEFFTDDPKVASKNLPAQMVDKLQVIDRMSEMAQMTGFDDGDDETVINLTVKKGMKQGVFGNAFAGYGNKDRYEANAMLNYMRNDTHISALGGINNTNNAGFTDFASSSAGGGGGRPRGVSFGGNNGITKAINGGFNIARESSKNFKWNGDIQYGKTDNNVISNSHRQYTTETEDIFTAKSWGNNNSQNIRSNFRLEWTPDSLTKIIFRPNIQYGRNINFDESLEELSILDNDLDGYISDSYNSSSGKSLNFTGRLDMSRRLNAKGRTISLSLSGGNNNSDSHGDSWFEKSFKNPLLADSIQDQRFLQDDKSYNFRAYLSYVEPLGRNNFLQLSYNIRTNHSETDKISYDKENGNYTAINNDQTRNVRNDFLNQNVTLSFQSIREKFDYTIGLGLEPSSSKTKIELPKEPNKTGPRKNYLSVAPNFTFNYKWDKRHNLRIRYRGRTSEPSTLQLFDGIISNNGTNITRGNPNLRPSFSNNVMTRYQKSDSERGSMLIAFARFNHTMNDIVSISTRREGGGRDVSYTNINGNMSVNLRVIFNTPLRNKKFSFNTMSFGGYTRSNTFVDELKNRANILRLQENMGINYRSDIVDFSIRGNLTYENVKNSNGKSNGPTYNYGGFASTTAYLPYNFTIDSDINYASNSGYSSGYKQDEWLWNASLSKQVLKNKAGTIRIKIYDILKKRSNISRASTAEYIQDTTTNTLSSYFMVHFVYRFQIFSGGVKAGDMQQQQQRGFGEGRPPHHG